jgi:hypothetical protein
MNTNSIPKGARERPANSEEEKIIEIFQENLTKFACMGLTNLVETFTRATQDMLHPEMATNSEVTEVDIEYEKIDYLTASGILDRSIEDRVAGKHDQPCTVCLDNAAIVLYLPCTHLICCNQCSLLLDECPQCRSPIDHKIHTYNNAS